jgi:NitT/TauT family transport system substrate-binding protein
MRSPQGRLFATILFFLALLGLATGPAQGQKLEKILLAYSSSVPGSDSTFLFAGKQLGFFRDEGIDLEIQTTAGTVAASGFVASGAMDLALGGLEGVPGHVIQGVPIKAVYVYAHRPIFRLAFLKGSKVQTVTELKGTRVGVVTLGSGSIPVLHYILREAGLATNDVTLVPLGLGAATVAAIKRGEVDALMYHDTAYPIFVANGMEIAGFFSSPRLEKGYAGQGIYGLERTLTTRRPAVEGFLRGLTKSLVYATRNPEGATKAFGLLHPEAAKNPKLEEAAWQERVKILALPADAKGQWGYMDRTAWENLLEVLVLGGVIKDRPPVDRLYTTEFLTAANQVDLTKLP